MPDSITTPFQYMLKTVLTDSEATQKRFAKGIHISPQYLCDLLQGKRGPHPEIVNRICDYMGRGPKGRLEWHTAGAKSVGWEI
jgi:transcriptional regulator with XRE-family HTH domain